MLISSWRASLDAPVETQLISSHDMYKYSLLGNLDPIPQRTAASTEIALNLDS